MTNWHVPVSPRYSTRSCRMSGLCSLLQEQLLRGFVSHHNRPGPTSGVHTGRTPAVPTEGLLETRQPAARACSGSQPPAQPRALSRLRIGQERVSWAVSLLPAWPAGRHHRRPLGQCYARARRSWGTAVASTVEAQDTSRFGQNDAVAVTLRDWTTSAKTCPSVFSFGPPGELRIEGGQH